MDKNLYIVRHTQTQTRLQNFWNVYAMKQDGLQGNSTHHTDFSNLFQINDISRQSTTFGKILIVFPLVLDKTQ